MENDELAPGKLARHLQAHALLALRTGHDPTQLELHLAGHAVQREIADDPKLMSRSEGAADAALSPRLTRQ